MPILYVYDFKVPVAARNNQAELMAFRWIRDSAKTKPKNISFADSLARELIDASNGTVSFYQLTDQAMTSLIKVAQYELLAKLPEPVRCSVTSLDILLSVLEKIVVPLIIWLR